MAMHTNQILQKASSSIGAEGLGRIITRRFTDTKEEDFLNAVHKLPHWSLKEIVIFILRNEGTTLDFAVAGLESVIELSSLNTAVKIVGEGLLEAGVEGLPGFIAANKGNRTSEAYKGWLVDQIRQGIPGENVSKRGLERRYAGEACVRTDKIFHWTYNPECHARGEHKIMPGAEGSFRKMQLAHGEKILCESCFSEAPAGTTARQVVIKQVVADPPPPDLIDQLQNKKLREPFELLLALVRLRDSDAVDDPRNWRHVSSGLLEAVNKQPRCLLLLPKGQTELQREATRDAIDTIRNTRTLIRTRRALRRRESRPVTDEMSDEERMIAEGAAEAQRLGTSVLNDSERLQLETALKIVKERFDSYDAFFAIVQIESRPGGIGRLVNDVRNFLDDMITNVERENFRDMLDWLKDTVVGFVKADLRGYAASVLSVAQTLGWIDLMLLVVGIPLTVFGAIGVFLPKWAPITLWVTYFLICFGVIGWSFVRRALQLGFADAFNRWGRTIAGLGAAAVFSPIIGATALGFGRPMWGMMMFVGWVMILLFAMLARSFDDVINLPLRAAHAIGNRRPTGPIDRLSEMIANGISNRYGMKSLGLESLSSIESGNTFKPLEIGRNLGTITTLVASFILLFTGMTSEFGIWWSLWVASSTGKAASTILGLFFVGIGVMVIANLGLWGFTVEYRARGRYLRVVDEKKEENLMNIERGKEILMVWRATRRGSVVLLLAMIPLVIWQIFIIGSGVSYYHTTDNRIVDAGSEAYKITMDGVDKKITEVETDGFRKAFGINENNSTSETNPNTTRRSQTVKSKNGVDQAACKRFPDLCE